MNVVVGLGKTGLSCIHYLLKRGMRVHALDTRAEPPLRAQLPQHPCLTSKFGQIDAADFAQATDVIVSPGVSVQQIPALPTHKALITDIELFARVNTTPVIAITGTNGKTTVTTLVSQLLSAAGLKVGVGGNIGYPVLQLLEVSYDIIVLELSSFQLEYTYSLRALAATVLNISADHLDRHHTLENYIRAKFRVFQQADLAVVNRDDVYGRVNVTTDHISFGLNSCEAPHFGLQNHQQQVWLAQGSRRLLPVSALPATSDHILANILAALALVSPLEIPQESLNTVLTTFTGLPHRTEWLGYHHNILWINDSKATNVGATRAALQGLTCLRISKWLLILGGKNKNLDFSELRPLIVRQCRAVVVLGEAAPALYELLYQYIVVQKATSLEQAVYICQRLAHPGDGVLLSPACSSLDMFDSFEQRGDLFKKCVQQLTSVAPL